MRLGIGLLLPAAAALAAGVALGATAPGALAAFAVAGLAAGGIAWANVNASRVKHFNLISLVLVGASCAAVEVGVRSTDTGASWSARGTVKTDDGWASSAMNDFDALAAAQHTLYPDRGYPVAFAAKRAPVRVVALGSSSTGGAYQNDNIDQFYPARLDEALGSRVDVVNQGVGGWTSLHARLYFEDRADELQADIVTVYLGHNDVLTESPVPYSELYRRWQGASAVTEGLARLLGGLVLYQGLRRAIAAAASTQDQTAVPPADAIDNLDAIAAAAAAHGGRTLLIGEAMHPDPFVLRDYYAAMQEVAEDREDTAWLDGGAVLAPLGAEAFLDDCHLTEVGHQALARAIAERLQELGWVSEATLR